MNSDMNTTEGMAELRPARSGRALRAGLLGLALGVGSIAGIAGPAGAAPDGSTIANVGVSTGITMTGLTQSFTLSGAPGETVEAVGAVIFNVETNNVAGYSVTVRSTTATMSPPAGTNPDTIPIADLTVRQTGTSSYTPMSSGTAVLVHTQPARSANGGDNLSNDYQIRIPVVNLATYSATLNYIAAAL